MRHRSRTYAFTRIESRGVSQRESHGFTLIELLVVIAIIVALLAILLPSMGQAMLVSQSAVCGSNLRQLHTAYLSLMSDRFMRGPDYNSGVGNVEWMAPLEKQHGGLDELRYCPTATELRAADATTWGTIGSATSAWSRPDYAATGEGPETGSYGFNGFLYGSIASGNAAAFTTAPFPNSWWYKMSDVERVAATPLFADCNWIDLFPHHDNLVPTDVTTGFQWHTLPGGGNKLYMLGRVVLDRHLRRVNVAFVDGHVQGVELEQLWNLRWSRSFVLQGETEVP